MTDIAHLGQGRSNLHSLFMSHLWLVWLSCYESIYPSVELFHLNSPLVPSGTRFYPVIRLVDLAHTWGRIVVQISYYFEIIEIWKIRNFRLVRTKFTKFGYLPCMSRGTRARYPSGQVLSIWYQIRSRWDIGQSLATLMAYSMRQR